MTTSDVETERPLVSFDHHSPEFAADPWSVLRELRQSKPVAFSDLYGGFWVLTRYEDIKQVAHDDITFSSADSITIPAKKNVGQRSIPIETDPPIFQEYRRVMAPLFAPQAIERMAPTVEAFVNRSIDEVIERGIADLVHDLAHPVPALSTLYKLGLPTEDWRSFAEPLHQTVYLRQDNPARANALKGARRIREVVVEAVVARRRNPRDDMITYLTRSEVEGRPLTDDEVVDMAVLTLQGGFDTTASAIGSALVHLDRDREDRRRLIEHPELLESAVEEMLRYEAPQLALARKVNRDTEIGGQKIRAGERVLMVWASGNRDESVFPDADKVVIDRTPNRHMTFGLGAHRCLGSSLARLEVWATLRAVLHRMPDYELEREGIVRAETVGISYGYLVLPARFTRAPAATRRRSVTVAWANGELLPAGRPVVPPTDRALFGVGVFETLRCRDGAVFALDRHMRRLARSAAGAGVAIDEGVVRDGVAAVLAEPEAVGAERALMRVTVTAGTPAGGGAPAGHGVTIVTLSPVAPWPPAARVCTVPWTRNPSGATAGLKTTSYADNAIALRHAHEGGADEALFLNTEGMVCEGAGSNVFAVLDGRLVTPTLDSGCLAGVTRELLLEWAPELLEEDIPLEALAVASEIFLTATSRDVHPVAVLDGRELETPPGPLTGHAMEVFAKRSVEEWSSPARPA